MVGECKEGLDRFQQRTCLLRSIFPPSNSPTIPRPFRPSVLDCLYLASAWGTPNPQGETSLFVWTYAVSLLTGPVREPRAECAIDICGAHPPLRDMKPIRHFGYYMGLRNPPFLHSSEIRVESAGDRYSVASSRHHRMRMVIIDQLQYLTSESIMAQPLQMHLNGSSRKDCSRKSRVTSKLGPYIHLVLDVD
ncbi:hypothetical protein BJV74DRAFT_109098 [Russula compacta]|nr:hypothetical protein BJV74DRAFT_109098 [Russula compacta]